MDEGHPTTNEKVLVSTAHDCGPINATGFNRMLTICAAKFFSRFKKRRLGCTCELPFGKIVKFDRSITLAEAHTIQFIARNTIVPVPEVYCAFTREKTGVTYIVEQKLPGIPIGATWRARSEESKARLLAHLKTLIDSMRSLEPPPDTGVHNLCGGQMYDVKVKWFIPFGPFASVEEFHRWLTNHLDYSMDESRWQNNRTMLDAIKIRRMHTSRTSWPLKFTHADLNAGNILVEGDQITGIIDWESSGWYPYYWEWARACIDTNGGYEKGHVHPKYAKHYLEQFPEECEAESLRSILFEQ